MYPLLAVSFIAVWVFGGGGATNKVDIGMLPIGVWAASALIFFPALRAGRKKLAISSVILAATIDIALLLGGVRRTPIFLELIPSLDSIILLGAAALIAWRYESKE